MDDNLMFVEENSNITDEIKKNASWKVIIADDESEIHGITKIIMSGVTFEKRGINFISAYSGKETKEVLSANPDAALILLDVVMETDQSGLEVAKYIRETLKNQNIRIVLRTGQPGSAPERSVIQEYEINDYKDKTELTAQKLFTTIMTSLRSYRDIITIEKSKIGLEKIIKSSADIFSNEKSLENFSVAIFEEFSSLLNIDDTFFSMSSSGFTAIDHDNSFEIISGTNGYSKAIHKNIEDVVDQKVFEKIKSAIINRHSVFFADEYIGYFCSKRGNAILIYLKGNHTFNELDKYLINVFSTNLSVAFDNIQLNQEIINTQREIVYRIGDVIETRSKATANHVKRVGEYSTIIAEQLKLDSEVVDLIKLASPLHDLGKISISDEVLNKPDKLTAEEFEIIKKHTTVGYDILKTSKRKILATAATIALEHHERWDGKGYPYGIKEENIDILGRIVAIADVFDALSHKRVYKEAWPIENVIEHIKNERGKHFDPQIVDVFVKNIDNIIEIKNKYPDEE